MAKINLSQLYRSEWISGILLVFSFFAAIMAANIDAFESLYRAFVFSPIRLGWGGLHYEVPLIQLVNDGLMTLFFLFIGLELKYHLVCGEFKDRKMLVLPSAAALGGVVFPALVYMYFNFQSPDTLKGWAIPIATDTAFLLGILSFFQKIVAPKLRAFIISFSLIDDALALMILAIFYSKAASFVALVATLGLSLLLFTLNYLKVRSSFYYLFLGVFLWIAMVKAGIHGTLGGILVALALPVEVEGHSNVSFHHLENNLRPLVCFFIVPLFAFINSGLTFDSFSLTAFLSPLSLGIVLGLFLGKQLGIVLCSYIAIQLKTCSLPEGVCWKQFYSIAVLGGIGFTLSLFIGDLTFELEAPSYTMRLGVIVGSLLSAALGIGVLSLLLWQKQHRSS